LLEECSRDARREVGRQERQGRPSEILIGRRTPTANMPTR
jgi:hypothetical protein